MTLADAGQRVSAALRRHPRRTAWIVVVLVLVAALVRGWGKAGEYEQLARQKLAVGVQYDRMEQPREFAYGPHVGTPLYLAGYDTALWVEPSRFAQDGSLRFFYEGLAQLEDRSLEDGLGINVRGLGRALLELGESGGGSGLHDQTCDALKMGARPILAGWHPAVRRVANKVDSLFCGIGLARRKSPEEVVALYATYGYLAPSAYGIESFTRIYWRFDGLDDPRLTPGHQLVLAAMFNRPWDGSDARWTQIRGRAQHAVELLLEAGVITDGEAKSIVKQIERARPKSRKQLRAERAPLRLPRVPPEMAYPVFRAAQEAQRQFGKDWRAEVRMLKLTIDGRRQAAAHRLTERALRRIGKVDVRGTVAVVDDRGQYLVLLTGSPNFDNIDRIRSRRSPGSIGKLFVAAGLAKHYGSVEIARHVPGMPDVQEALRRSDASFVELSARLPIDREYVDRVIECHGDAHEGPRDDSVVDAAMGAIAASPEQLLPMLQDAFFGIEHAMPAPHVVRGGLGHGGEDWTDVPEADPRRLYCAQLIHNQGHTYGWFEIPMGGTMRRAHGSVEVGKTGTVGPSADVGVNNMTLAIGGIPTNRRRGFETGIVVLGADAMFEDGAEILISGLEAASQSAVVLLADVMDTRRKK